MKNFEKFKLQKKDWALKSVQAQGLTVIRLSTTLLLRRENLRLEIPKISLDRSVYFVGLFP